MSSDLIHRKDRIIFTAIDVMNELGVQALSTKRIAALEHISESTVFKHFENKNTLLLAVLDYYAQYDEDIYQTICMRNSSASDSILYYVEAFGTYYENYPAITAITQGLDEMRYIEFLEPKVRQILEGRHACLHKLVKEALNEKDTPQLIEAEMLATIIDSTLHGIIRQWRLCHYAFSLKEKLNKAIENLISVYGLNGRLKS